MRLRSLLFVPGDRPDRMMKAVTSDADALILDLEDSVAAGKKAEARQAVAAFLAMPRALPIFVRINGVDAERDLEAVIPARPDGIVLPKAEGGQALAELDRHLTALGDTEARILPIATETPAAIFALGSYGGVSERLCGLSWGVEDLSAAVGATTAREDDGRYTPLFETVRALALFAARAAGVPAIETIFPALNDKEGLKAYAGRGRRDGFTGMLAIHPSQIAIINQAFTPSAVETEWARRVVDAFAANPHAGVLQMDGQMLDAPHLARAKNILGSARDK
jgi:citrate lyase subunit beta / citryl-CoA lyase